MAPDRTATSLTGRGTTFAAALEQVLNECARRIASVPPPAENDVSIRLRADAASLPDLVARMVDALAGAVADYGALPASITVDGYRPIEDGHRAWATAVIAPLPRRHQNALHVRSTPVVAESDGTWQITVEIGIA